MAYSIPTHDPTPGGLAPSSWGDNVNSDLTFLNTAFHVPLFPASSGQVDSNIAAMAYAMGSGAAGTPVVEFPILQANGTATSARKWVISCPPAYGGSLYVRGHYYMPVAGSAAFVIGARVAAFSVGGTITGESFAAQSKGTVTADTVAGRVAAFTLTPTALDGLVAGDPVSIEFERLPADAGDTEGGTVNFTDLDAYFSLQG